MSLLKELQDITERTYQQYSGVNLEDFVIGPRRFADLSEKCSHSTFELSDSARVFFRRSGANLLMSIYFSDWLISELENNDPRQGLNEKNIEPFMVFIEEINHGVHGAIKFKRGEQEIGHEDFAKDLELMAKIDSYQILKFFLAYFNPSNRLQNLDRLWLKHHLFERARVSYESAILNRRYGEANFLGEKFTRYLDGLPPSDRVVELRQLQMMPYSSKAAYVRMLPS